MNPEQQSPESEPLFKELAQELLQMSEADQTIRREERWLDAEKIDQANTERLKKIIADIGWPSKTRVGEGAAHAAWLIVQHADSDPEWQAECLQLMKQESAQEVATEDVAYLEDRVLVAQGKPQRFGTQFYVNEQGVYGPQELDDVGNLEQRRIDAGMEPFSEYKDVLEKAWADRKIRE